MPSSDPDPLSQALAGLRITGAVFFNADFTAPWAFTSPESSTIAPILAPESEHLVIFHLVTQGQASAEVDTSAWESRESVALQAGDVVVFPHGDAHTMWNGRGAPLVDSRRILNGTLVPIRVGGGGEPTQFVCGYFGCERFARRLFLAGLPPVFKVNLRGDEQGGWLESSIRHSVIAASSTNAGRLAVLSKLSEALFVETLCRYMDALPAERTGWLAAARDAVAGAALAGLHRDPSRAWTLDALAKHAGTSRSVLVERFTHFVGTPPLTYLAQLRLHLGARLLETSDSTVLAIAQEVGYESEAAFSRAFRREHGMPPARYRRARRGRTPAPRDA